MGTRTVVRLAVALIVVAALFVPAVSAAADRGPKGKVEVCHVPPGDPGNAHTISISPAALDAHRAHGDTSGRCPIERPGAGVPGDRSPVADAGSDRCVLLGDAVRLDGRDSYDPDHDTLTYDWDLRSSPSGSSATDASLHPDDRSVTPTFTPDRLGSYRFELEVRDPDGRTDSDTVDVAVRMGVGLDRRRYEVDEGDTVAVRIALHAVAPQPVTVAITTDPTEAVIVFDDEDGVTDAVHSVVIGTGHDDVVVYLLGVGDADARAERSLLTVTVGGIGCSASDTATVVVDDDEPASASAPRVPSRLAARIV